METESYAGMARPAEGQHHIIPGFGCAIWLHADVGTSLAHGVTAKLLVR